MQAIFEKFAEISPLVWGVLASLVLVALFIGLATRSRRVWTTQMLVYAALSMALAFVLSYIRLYRLPQGGSVTPGSMLPVMLFAYAFGTVPGLIVGALYGLLQLLQDMFVVHPIQLLMDYVFAFGALGLAGLFRRKNLLWPGVLAGGFVRFLFSFFSGIIFFSEYAPEGQSVWLYSLGYSGSTIGVETVICVVLALIPALKTLMDRLREQMTAVR